MPGLPITPADSALPAPQPPCAARPDNWDLDVGSKKAWHMAISICLNCPMLESCRMSAKELTAQGIGPRSMIWAGVAYNAVGRIVDDIDHYHPPSRTKPSILRIVRTAAADSNLPTSSPAQAVRRHFVIGHRNPQSTSHRSAPADQLQPN